ncbi:hypothetical protein NPIL_266901 [Nephila pilipes]|uniref:Uncharacterized protein n=1 Tax=Nephila pilipes TaxID=299642 RepID=A0A8X6Q119_NEPPI|nr:hypothetical protein NPIL_266901 [Nephila pilipes]
MDSCCCWTHHQVGANSIPLIWNSRRARDGHRCRMAVRVQPEMRELPRVNGWIIRVEDPVGRESCPVSIRHTKSRLVRDRGAALMLT